MERCPEAIAWPVLESWWLDPSGAGDDGLAEHALACAACHRRLQWLATVGDAIGAWAAGGRCRGAATRAVLERLAAGLQVRRYALRSGDSIHCTAGADDDLVVLELSAELATTHRVDLLFRRADGSVAERAEDVPVVDGREVIWAERGRDLRLLPAHDLGVELWSVDAAGERLVARYQLHHVPFRG